MAVFLSLLLLSSFLAANAKPAPYGLMADFSLHKRDTSFPAGIDNSCTYFQISNSDAGFSTDQQVCVSIDKSTGELIVTYPTSPQGYSYVEQHVWISCTEPKTKSNTGGVIVPNGVGEYGYTTPRHCQNLDGGTSAVCKINIKTALAGCMSCGSTFYIITHAKVTKTIDGVTTSQTGAGRGKLIDNPWHRMYWNPTFYCLCTTTITFAPHTIYSTIYNTNTVTSTSTTSYTTTSTDILTITTTSTSIYDTTEYYPITSTTTSSSTSVTTSTPANQYATSTCS